MVPFKQTLPKLNCEQMSEGETCTQANAAGSYHHLCKPSAVSRLFKASHFDIVDPDHKLHCSNILY